jgi:thiamine kinase-like enzyme
MKISYLIDREPFDKIFEETFSLFLDNFIDHSHTVKWHPKSHYNKKSSLTQLWYCNPLINSIFVKGANPSVFNSISGEYANNPLKPWRSLIQRLYLGLAKFKFTAPLLSKYAIYITPPIEDAKNKLIIGGNTKIRLIDFANRKVYVILKNGFDKKYLDKEIYVRTNFPNLPIPKIHTYGNNGLWYSEEYISGKSPDRVSGNKGHDALLKAIQYLHKMLNETKKREALTEYVACLQDRIYKNIDQISRIDTSVKDKISDLVSTIVTHLDKSSYHDICTAYCHGDFQQGNVLCDGDKIWILDWEYSGKKQIGYDLFVLLLKSRVSKGFSNRFINWMKNNAVDEYKELINCWPEIKLNMEAIKEIYLLLFLLEELDFHLSENDNNLFWGISIGLNDFYKELEKIVIELI